MLSLGCQHSKTPFVKRDSGIRTSDALQPGFEYRYSVSLLVDFSVGFFLVSKEVTKTGLPTNAFYAEGVL